MLEKNLNELNIFALRDLARRTGVPSPTSKKKEELIRGIVDIVSGAKKPNATKSKQGRPPKVFGYNFANVLNFNVPMNSGVTNSQKFNQNKLEYESIDMITVAGWLELVNNNSALLWVERNLKNESYFVPSELLSGLNVKVADRVVAEVGVDENVKIVKKIFSVNGCPILQMTEDRVSYENVAHEIPTKNLIFKKDEFSKLNLKKGENVYLYGNSNNSNTTAVVKMLMSCDVENKIYINVSLAEKNKIFLSGLEGVEKFVTNITDEVDVSKRIVYLAIERSKRIIEEGEDVVVVVDDVSSIEGLDDEGKTLVKSLVSTTKATEKKGSITLLAIMPNQNINQIEKLADRRLEITDDIIEIKN